MCEIDYLRFKYLGEVLFIFILDSIRIRTSWNNIRILINYVFIVEFYLGGGCLKIYFV